MSKKFLVGKATKKLLLRFSLGLVAAACATAGCILLPYGNSQAAPSIDPLPPLTVETVPLTSLKLVCASVELDLSVSVCDESNQTVTGQTFILTVTPSDGEVRTVTDDDQNGLVELSDLPEGECTVALTAPEGFAAPEPATVAIAPAVVLEVVDVSDKVVDAADVNEAQEDAQFNRPGGADDAANSTEESVEVAPAPPTNETPSTPSQPSEPSQPTDPSQPTEPSQPSTPEVTNDYAWRSVGEDIYYMTSGGVKVTGLQRIDGVAYHFTSGGVLQGQVGIDVSYAQGSIDWQKVKDAGITYAIIRLGYRGASSGVLARDSWFTTNITGALNAGLKVGLYFFSAAATVEEAVEEASMCVQYARQYTLSYPIVIDSEWNPVDGPQADKANALSTEQRTKICAAFCETVRSAGYTPAIYASKSWLNNQLDMSQLSQYETWLAHYTSNGEPSSYTGAYCMWQYTSSGKIDGISGSVDLNISYMETPPAATPVAQTDTESVGEASLPENTPVA